MKNPTRKNKTTNREELSKSFAICTCILILLSMAAVLLLDGCSAKEPVHSDTVTTSNEELLIPIQYN